MNFWKRSAPAAPKPTASEAARLLGEIGRETKARRAAMLDRLKTAVARGEIANLGWRA